MWEPFWILFVSDHLWESIFLSLYENKQAYQYHYLKQIFYHQNMIMIFCRFPMFPFYVFLPWILLILCVTIFMLNKVPLNSLNSVAILTYLPSIFFMECSFDFNPTNSTIIFHSDSSFVLPITFFTGRIKKLWIFWIITFG